MFFIDKYALKSVDKTSFHKELFERLLYISKNESIPHILFSGPEGSGKKTIIRLFLEMLFDKDINNLEDSTYTVTGSGNKITEVVVKQSNYHIVIEPGSNNFDRYLIQDIVKEYAKKMPMNIFKTKKIFKIVLINNIDNLSYYAQTSLRRTMEKYSNTCRFIMWCSSPSRVIDPLISRCIFITIRPPSNQELFQYIYEISIHEKINLELEDYNYIINTCQNNIKEALWLLQLYKFGYNKKNVYHTTIEVITNMIIARDLDKVYQQDKTETSNIRNLLYNLMITNISGTRILRDILNKLCENPDIPEICKYSIISYIAQFEHNLIKGRRNIIHIEAPIIKIMHTLYKYGLQHPEHNKIFDKYGQIFSS